jgi:hypothetical protein
MFWFFMFVLLVGVVLWRLRVPLLARVLGQPESRIRSQIERRKK